MITPTNKPIRYEDEEESNIKFGGTQFRVGNDGQRRSPENVFIANSIIDSAKWVLFSNKIVAYWPFSIRFSLSGKRYLNFYLPTVGFFLTLLYILINIFYVVYYFLYNFAKEAKEMAMVDLILITIWDLMVIVGVTAYRMYGLLRISQFQKFWDGFIDTVEKIVSVSSEEEFGIKLRSLRKWSLKCLVVSAILGILDSASVIYNYGYLGDYYILTPLLYAYLESVICMHCSSALMLIFFIKLMTFGFTSCKKKMQRLFSSLVPFDFNFPTKALYNENNKEEELNNPIASTIDLILHVIDDLEKCVDSFNQVFGVSLFLDAVLGFWQVMFAMYFLHVAPIQNVVYMVNMLIPIILYPACLIGLCVASTALTEECTQMLSGLQNVPVKILNDDQIFKIQIVVSRLAAAPPGIQVAQLFQIRESLLGSALNTLATYFIVLIQMRQIGKPSSEPENSESVTPANN